MRINAWSPAKGRVMCDFGEGAMLPGETVRDAAVRIYRAWCQPEQGDSIEPDPSPEVVVHGC